MSTALQPYTSTQFCVGFLTASIWLLKTCRVKQKIILLFCLERTPQSSKRQLQLGSKENTLRVRPNRSKCFNSCANEVPKSEIYRVPKGLLAWASNHSKAVYCAVQVQTPNKTFHVPNDICWYMWWEEGRAGLYSQILDRVVKIKLWPSCKNDIYIIIIHMIWHNDSYNIIKKTP